MHFALLDLKNVPSRVCKNERWKRDKKQKPKSGQIFEFRVIFCLSHLLMAKAKKLPVFEGGWIVEISKALRSVPSLPRSEAAKQAFSISSKNPGGTKSQLVESKSAPALSRRTRWAVRQDRGRSTTQIKTITCADCSIQPSGSIDSSASKGKKTSSKATSLPTPENCAIWTARERQMWTLK